MSLADVVAMVEDWDLRMRLVACAAQEQDDDPGQFVDRYVFRLCSAEAFQKAWAAHRDETDPASHVTDGMIRTAVRDLVKDHAARKISADEAAQAAANLRRAEDREHQFQDHVRMRQWEIDNAPPPPGNGAAE